LGPHPTVQAAAAVADLLREDGFPVAAAADDENESEGEVEDKEGSDVDTDASSDSGDEADEADDLKEHERASVNVTALGEHALACTIHELDEMGPRMGDLAEFLKRKSGPLSATEQKCPFARAWSSGSHACQDRPCLVFWLKSSPDAKAR
jgi:hypothetical protein